MKTSLLVLLSSLCLQQACAQLTFGIKGGLNVSDVVLNNLVYPEYEAGYKAKAGIHAGLFSELRFDDHFSLVGEVLYSVKGVKALGTNVNLNYVAVPLLLEYLIAGPWAAEGGIEIGYLMSATSKYGNLNSVWDNKVDLGLDAGLKYRKEKFSVGIRFNAGMSNIVTKADDGPSGEKIRYQNRVLSVSVGYMLRQLER